jgi:hypothetical protein
VSAARILLDIEVLEYLRTLRSAEQRDLARRFKAIGAAPDKFTDYLESDASGRDVSVHVFGRFAIKFWDDFADRHVKILDVHEADRRAAG